MNNETNIQIRSIWEIRGAKPEDLTTSLGKLKFEAGRDWTENTQANSTNNVVHDLIYYSRAQGY